MAYFQELPNISYPSLLPSRSKAEDRIIVKNIFRRSKLRTDVDQSLTAFDYYYVQEGQRPDTLAQDLYQNSEFDWVILTTNNITNIRDQWPLDHNDLHNYMLEKYGSEQNIAGIHHYETKKIVDEYGRTIMREGLEVDVDFTFKYQTLKRSILNVNPVAPITNYQYETKLNEEKRKIKTLKPQYLGAFISEHKQIMTYERSSDFISKRLKNTYNPRISGV